MKKFELRMRSHALAVAGIAAVLLLTPGDRPSSRVSARGQADRPSAGVPSRQQSDKELSLIRASFGKASHVVTATVVDAVVYKRSGEKLEDMPEQLGRRQYLDLELRVARTLSPRGGGLPGKISVRLEAPGLGVYGFLFGLLKEEKVFFLKKDFGSAGPAYYYPADATLFFADKSRAAEVDGWVKSRAEKTPASPRSARGFYRVPGAVPHVLQEGGYDCWAAAAAMMLSWRDQSEYTKQDVARTAGPHFVRLLAAKGEGGLDATAKREFLSKLGLVAEAPQTFTVSGLRELLEEHGPLWVTVNAGDDDDPEFLTPHARVIIALEGDGSPDGTFITYLDPDPFAEGGRQSMQEFTRTFELVARGDLKSATAAERQPFRAQILHF